MSVSYPTKVLLAFRSGGICPFPGCGRSLTYEAEQGADVYTGEAAHVRGEKPGAARYDSNMTDEARDAVENLLYMCGDHHTVIDKAVADWTVDRLMKLKSDHETRVREVIEEGFASVAFPELSAVVSWVATEPPAPLTIGFSLVPPENKIKKNELGNGARNLIAAGLGIRRTVAQFIESEAQLDSDFPERLKAGFLAQYYTLRKQGAAGDQLFEMMCAFAARGAPSAAQRIAGIAVLVYLFEICDVFEK
jgi:hypothetical protein